MNLLSHIADRVLGRPLFIHQAKAAMILSVLGERIGVQAGDTDDIEETFKQELASKRPTANRLIGVPTGLPDENGRVDRYLYNLAGGVAVIPVVGSLVNRGAYTGARSGLSSYEGLAAQVNGAVADPRVHSILLDIDSPGGEATGMFALADTIRAARSRKPVTALIDDLAASAAYGIASSATEIVGSPTSIAGSIGVVLLHMDQSKELEMKGRKATLIYAGAKKVDGNPLGPLSESVRADLQADVDTFYARFVETVAAGRPGLSADAIRATEADTYIGAEAVRMGLVDRIGTFSETLMRVSDQGRQRSFKQKGLTMTTQENDLMTRADHNAALATATAAARAEGVAEGRKEGASTAVARIRSILDAPEAKGREAMAMVFAFDSDMSLEVAVKALAAAPVAAPATQTPPLADRGQPPVGTKEATNAQTVESIWASAVDAVNAEHKRYN